MRLHELTDEEWASVAPLLPNKPPGVARVDDRPVINDLCQCSAPREPQAQLRLQSMALPPEKPGRALIQPYQTDARASHTLRPRPDNFLAARKLVAARIQINAY